MKAFFLFTHEQIWNRIFLFYRQKQSKGSQPSTYPLCLSSFWAQEANSNHGYSIQAVAVQLTKLSGIGFPTVIIFYRKKYTLEIRKLRWSPVIALSYLKNII